MKKSTRLFLNMAMAATMFAGYGLVRAQDQNAAMTDQAGDAPAAQDGQGDMGGKHMDRLKKKLGLTDAQAKKIEAAFKKEAEANKPLRDQEKIDVDTLQQKVDSKASDDDIKALLDKLKSDRKQLQDARENSMEKMRTILTPTQQAKWVLMMSHGPMGGDWGGKGRWGHKPGDKKGGDQPAPDNAGATAPAPDSAQ